MQIGDYIEQKASGTIGLIIAQLKNGSFKILAHSENGGQKVKQTTTHYWHPSPVVIDKNNVPAIVIKRIETYRLHKAIYGK